MRRTSTDETMNYFREDAPQNERSPLLPSIVITKSEAASKLTAIASSESLRRPQASFRRRHALPLLLLFMLLVEVGDFSTRAPWPRMLESVVCQRYYVNKDPSKVVDGQVDEAVCKIPEIQSALGTLLGWELTFSYIPALLLAVPYALLADCLGRKPALFLACTGLTLNQAWRFLVAYFAPDMDIRWIWASNLFITIGGGNTVALATVCTMAADIVPPAERTRAFTLIMSAALLAGLVATPAGAFLMKFNLWLPLLGSLGFLACAVVMTLILPETLPAKTPRPPATPEEGRRSVQYNAQHAAKKAPLWKQMVPVYFFDAPLRVKLLAIAFLGATFGRNSTTFLLPMASERFSWSLSRASNYLPLYFAITFLVLVFGVPWYSRRLREEDGKDSVAADLIVARTSVTCLAVGSLIIAIAPVPPLMTVGVAVYACGIGFSAATRSVATSMVPVTEVASLYAVLAIFDTLGGIIAGYGLSEAYKKGLELGGTWTGLAFIVAAALFGCITVVVGSIQLPEQQMREYLQVPGSSSRYSGHR